jgi:polyhydroxybutyrate depolymerase
MGDASPLTAARRPRARLVLAACLTALALAACGHSAPAAHTASAHVAGLHSVTIGVGGMTRTYLLDAPAGGGNHPRPLVLVYHGAEDTAAHTAASTDLAAVARRRHEIIAFLQGVDDTWNEGAGNTPARQAGADDVAFTRAVVGRIESGYRVDRARVAAVGFSNGALLADLLGCRLAAQVRLIVPVEGQLPVSVSPGCRPAQPVSVFEVHGTADASIPYGGGHFAGIGGGTTVLSAPAAAARWAALDRCSATASSTTHGSSTLAVYAGCADGAGVTLDTIHGGTHAWPPDIGELVADALDRKP